MGRWTQVTLSPEREAAVRAELDAGLARIVAREAAEAADRKARRNMWLAHHWPDHYEERCVMVGSTPVCRRCASLYPLGLLVAAASAAGFAPWPHAWDPWPIWLLSIPGTVAYVGEATGLFGYNVRWQVATTLLAAMAFGRGLGYELVERWSSQFWGPIAVFGGIWYLATIFGNARRRST